jgi:hypothetical protein
LVDLYTGDLGLQRTSTGAAGYLLCSVTISIKPCRVTNNAFKSGSKGRQFRFMFDALCLGVSGNLSSINRLTGLSLLPSCEVRDMHTNPRTKACYLECSFILNVPTTEKSCAALEKSSGQPATWDLHLSLWMFTTYTRQIDKAAASSSRRRSPSQTVIEIIGSG